MKMDFKLVAALALAVFSAFAVQGANIIKDVFVNADGSYKGNVIYVARSGDDTATGKGGWENAVRTIQKGVDLAATGDTVLVGPGDYNETTDRSYTGVTVGTYVIPTVVYINKKIYLKSSEGKAKTFITGAWSTDPSALCGVGPGAKRCVALLSAGAVVDGFTVRKGSVPDQASTGGGGALACTGAGVCGQGGQDDPHACTANAAYIVNSTIEDCRAAKGGAISQVVSINCLFRGNVACAAAAVGYRFYNSYNCIFTGNGVAAGASAASTLIAASAPHCSINDTFVQNYDNSFDGAAANERGRAINCAFLDDAESGGNGNFYATNCVCSTGASRKSDGPGCKQFVNKYQLLSTLEEDFRPIKGSDLIDAGNNDIFAAFPWVPDDFRDIDFYGNPRKTGASIDVGAVESQDDGVEIACAPIALESNVVVKVGDKEYTSEYKGQWIGFTTFPGQVRVTPRDPNAPEFFGYNIAEFTGTAWNGYRYPDRTADRGIWFMPFKTCERGTKITLSPADGVLWVDASYAGGDSDGSEAKPYATIQAAVNAAPSGKNTVIRVRPGTYTAASRAVIIVELTKGLSIRSTEGPEKTVLKGGDNVRGVLVDTIQYNVAISGFTITGANVPTLTGGGLSLPVNSVAGNGAIGNSSNVQVLDSVISNNYAYCAAGLYGGWAQRCLFADNRGTTPAAGGNANRGSAVKYAILSACLVVDNPVGVIEQVDYSAIYNCSLSCERGTINVFGQPNGTYNCMAMKGNLPGADPNYVKSSGNVMIETSYADARFGKGYSDWRQVIVNLDTGDFRIREGSEAINDGSSDGTNLCRFAVGDYDGSQLFFPKGDMAPMPGAFQVVAAAAKARIDVLHGKDVSPSAGTLPMFAGESLTVAVTNDARCLLRFNVVTNGVEAVLAEGTREFTWSPLVSSDTLDVTVEFATNWYVSVRSGADSNNGWTPETAKRTLKGILSLPALYAGDVVHVAPGDYDEGEMTNTIYYVSSSEARIGSRAVVPDDVTLISDEGAAVTRIFGRHGTEYETSHTGMDALRGVSLGYRSQLIGFTIVNGSTRSGSGGAHEYCVGGGVAAPAGNDLAKTAIIRDCEIYGGGARNAAGVYGGIIDHCYLHDLISASDATASMYSRIENSVISNTSATAINQHCGIYSSTIVSSSSCSDTEMNAVGDSPVENSVVWLAQNGAQAVTTKKNWRNCIVNSGNEKIVFDPATCDNVRGRTRAELKLGDKLAPAADSPVIDAGDNSLLDNLFCGSEGDFAHSPRILSRTVDIGAWEFDWRSVFASVLLQRGAGLTVTTVDPEVVRRDDAIEIFNGRMDIDWITRGKHVSLQIDVVGNGVLTVYRNGRVVKTFGHGAATYSFDSNSTEQMTFEYAKASSDTEGVLLKGFGGAGSSIILFR